MNLLIKDIDICLVYMSLIYTHTLHMFNKMAGVPKGVENFLKRRIWGHPSFVYRFARFWDV